MKNNDDIARNSTDYLERKIKREVRDKSYQVVHGSLDHLKEKRKIRVHRKNIDNIQKFDTEINSYNQDYNSQSNLDKKIDNNNHKINEINTNRNKYLDQREEMLNKNPNLHSSLNHLEGQHFDRSAATSNDYNTNSKEYKTSRQKKYNQSQMNNARQYNITKEKDLDNDGIPDRIDIDDTRNSVQTTSDLYKVGNRTDKTHINTQKKINQKKMKDNFSFENDPEVKDKKSSSKKTFSKDQERKLRKNVQKKSMLGSPLTSQVVGKRTKTQKVLLAPTKAVSGVGASLKENLNKEIENSDMEGVKLANDIVSPLAKKLKFESNSLIAKKVGFDRKAYNLSKVEKKIMKADKKAFKIKKAQRKNIRKKARINAKTVHGSKLGLAGRVRAITSLSATQIKDKILFALKRLLTAIKSIKFIAGASGLILVAVKSLIILVPIIILGGGFALSNAEEQQTEISGIDVDFDLEGEKLAFPVPNFTAVSSSYGWRIHPITYKQSFHTGTDIPAPLGTPVIASADGKVIESGWKGGYGNTVMIDHGSGVVTLYAHNSSLEVKAGQTVTAGQVIAKVGSTGQSTGPHSHFEVRVNGEYTNPLGWIK